jgi:hypothetical protein
MRLPLAVKYLFYKRWHGKRAAGSVFGLAPAPSGNARRLARPLLSYNLTSSQSLPLSCDFLALLLPPSFAALMAPPSLPPPFPLSIHLRTPLLVSRARCLRCPLRLTTAFQLTTASRSSTLSRSPCAYKALARSTLPEKTRAASLREGFSRPCKPSKGR